MYLARGKSHGLIVFVVVQVMSIIAVLSLRSPDNAARAIEAGAGDLAIQAMQSFPGAHQMQRNACSMIRNLAVRNPENRQAAFFIHFGLFLLGISGGCLTNREFL